MMRGGGFAPICPRCEPHQINHSRHRWLPFEVGPITFGSIKQTFLPWWRMRIFMTAIVAAALIVACDGLQTALGQTAVTADAGHLAKRSPIKPLVATDIFNIELANDPQIAPDGSRIVYVRAFNDITSDKRCSNLWIVNRDGTDNRPLTTGNHKDAQPRWSSDGKHLAYVSDQDGSPQIYRRWMDTGQTARLSNLTSAPAGIAWSPDGKWISFAAQVPEDGPQIIKMPKAPAGAKWAEPARVIDKLMYRYNITGYFKPGYIHLFVLSSEGGTPRQISSGAFQHGELAFNASDAVWRPTQNRS